MHIACFFLLGLSDSYVQKHRALGRASNFLSCLAAETPTDLEVTAIGLIEQTLGKNTAYVFDPMLQNMGWMTQGLEKTKASHATFFFFLIAIYFHAW